MSLVRLAAVMAPLAAVPCRADTISDFYAGKRITLIVAAGEGATYDLAGRLVAKYLRNYIAGAPTIVTQNMPGASQTRGTEYSFNLAPRDGTSLLIAQPSVILNKLLKPAARYDIQEFTWIGRITPTTGVGIVWHGSPVHSFADAKTHTIIMGANSPTGPASMLPTALNRLAGTKFKIVRGYEAENREFVAMERGEIEGIGNVISNYLLNGEGWVRRGLARPIYAASLQRLAELPQVPTIVEVTEGEEGRAVMRLMAGISSVGLNVMAPPSMPADRTEALRRAFDKMVTNTDFIADFTRLGFTVNPMTGEKLAGFVKENFSPSAETVARLKTSALGE